MKIRTDLPSAYYLRLYNFYKNAKNSDLNEWVSNGKMTYLELLNYHENYEYILNHLGQPIPTNVLPIRGSYTEPFAKITKGLNFAHEKEMYISGPWQANSPFMIELRNLFKRSIKHIDESFISIPPILLLPGHTIDDSKQIISNNFYRQGIQFDYMIDKIYSREKVTTILEIGGGLGNMAHYQKKYDPTTKYILLDIPQTLLIQYHFLYTLGYNCVILDDSDDINQIISSGDFDMLFILPHHIEKICDDSIDLVVNFDSLVEMNEITIQYYIEHTIRISKYFYTVNKVYNNWNVMLNVFTENSNKLKLLDMSDQVFSNSSEYFFWIALSSGYKIMLFEKLNFKND